MTGREHLFPQARGLEGAAYSGSMTVYSLMAVPSRRCPNLLDSAAAGLASSTRRRATMTLYASHDTRGRDVEIGIDAEYSPDEAIIHFDRLRWHGRNRPGWAKGRQ